MEEGLPSIRWPFVAGKVKEIILEIRWNREILDNGMQFRLILQCALKEIERTIVLVVEQILHILMKGQSQLVPIIILAHFELCLAVLLQEVAMRPSLQRPTNRAS